MYYLNDKSTKMILKFPGQRVEYEKIWIGTKFHKMPIDVTNTENTLVKIKIYKWKDQ